MSQDRKMYKCTCFDCKKETEVPFEPKADRQYIVKNVTKRITKSRRFRLVSFD